MPIPTDTDSYSLFALWTDKINLEHGNTRYNNRNSENLGIFIIILNFEWGRLKKQKVMMFQFRRDSLLFCENNVSEINGILIVFVISFLIDLYTKL